MKKFIYWKPEKNKTKWIPIPDTPEERKEAIKNGAMFFTTMALSELDSNNPIRYGDLVLDLDGENSLKELRILIGHLSKMYEVDPYQLHYYISGGKGFHLIIPKAVFNSISDKNLPLIQKLIVAEWKASLSLDCIDMSMYCLGKGKMLRIENVKRDNGHYKVPATYDEILSLSMEELTKFTLKQRFIDKDDIEDPEPNQDLIKLFHDTKIHLDNEQEKFKDIKPLSDEVLQKLKEKIPDCINYILLHKPAKSAKIDFNKLCMNTAKYFITAKYTLKDTLEILDAFLQGYNHSQTYNTLEKRLNEFKKIFYFYEGTENSQFQCSYILGLGLPGSAFECKKCLLKENEEEKSKWEFARELFPRTSFPWEIYQDELVKSFKQLARSCATSDLAIPGAAMCIMASVLGGTIKTSPKFGWNAPNILWIGDMRSSGDGKSPLVNALMKQLHKAQKEADRKQKQLEEEEILKPKKEQKPIPRGKSYYITNLTLEGLHADSSGHGGVVCNLDELSSMISGQNQYKSKGTDREAWLALHNGVPARIVRADKSKTINNCYINIFGGIQPLIFKKVFSSENGTFLQDGTVFRFLFTFERSKYFELSSETWTKENKKLWDDTLERAICWANYQIEDSIWSPQLLELDEEAQKIFFDWRNDIYSKKAELPEQLQGFLPKIVEYALRLTGIIYCTNQFFNQKIPLNIIRKENISKGIRAAMFYMGHIVDAMESLTSDVNPIDIDEETLRICKILSNLKNDIDNGHLSIGFIAEKYNETTKLVKSSNAMGALLRQCGLTIPPNLYNANGKKRCKCLVWDKKTDSFINKFSK